jgi:hypothetical protein
LTAAGLLNNHFGGIQMDNYGELNRILTDKKAESGMSGFRMGTFYLKVNLSKVKNLVYGHITTQRQRKLYDTRNIKTANKVVTSGGVSSPRGSFVVAESTVLRINFVVKSASKANTQTLSSKAK